MNEMTNQVIVSLGKNRWDTNFREQHTPFLTFVRSERFSHPPVGKETLEEYKAKPKDEQDNLKDVGCYVFSKLKSGGRRQRSNIESLYAIVLDYDSPAAGHVEEIKGKLKATGCEYCIHSTRKHTAENPRVRVVVALNRAVDPDEYEASARIMAEWLGMEGIDKTTFQCNRLYFFPSLSSDSEYVYETGGTAPMSADGLLDMYTKQGKDWHRCKDWPKAPGEDATHMAGRKQADPETKTGIIGAYIKYHNYDVRNAMQDIPGTYVQCDQSDLRYTYMHGSTAGGAIIEDGGKFLYSFHATDPCSGKLVNCFDMVRLHKFGDLDENASLTKMKEFAMSIPKVRDILAEESRQEALKDFEGLVEGEKPPIGAFHKFTAQGKPQDTLDGNIEDYAIQALTLFVQNGKPFIYEDGCYRLDEDGREVKAFIRGLILPDLVNSPRINRIFNLFLDDNRIAKGTEDVNNYPAHWINFRNGMLDTMTGELHEHDPGYFSINQIPHDYDPEVRYEGSVADRFLQGIIPDEEDRNMFFAFVGYCMTVDTSFQKFLVLLGPPGVGKSTANNIIIDLLGSQNISAIPMQDLNERFMSAVLLQKLANICSDIPGTPMQQTSTIKLITGEDPIPAEYKHGKHFTFRSYAKLIFSANEMPSVLSENPEAFYRRLMIIEVNHKGPEIRNLKEGLKASIPALITKCVKELQKHLILSLPLDSPNSKTTVEMLKTESDSVRGFLAECLKQGPRERISQPVLYEHYCTYCFSNQWRPKKKSRVYAAIRAMGFENHPSNGENVFYGISLKQ